MASGPTIGEFRVEYASSLISSVAYGAYIVIVSLSLYLFQNRRNNYQGRRVTLIYTVGMSLITTVWFVTGARTSAFLFIDMWFAKDQAALNVTCSAVLITSKVASMLQILASDGALLYRASVLWDHNLRVIAPLLIIYLVSIGFGIMSELFCASEALYFASTLLHAVTFITTVVLNLLTTLAIAGRIWVVRRRMNASYTVRAGVEGRIASVVAVLVESAALYAIVGIAVVPEFVGGADAASVLGTLLQCLAFLSPALIILRVALGVSFDNNVAGERSSTLFAAPRSELASSISPIAFGRTGAWSEKTPSPVEQLRRFADPGLV